MIDFIYKFIYDFYNSIYDFIDKSDAHLFTILLKNLFDSIVFILSTNLFHMNFIILGDYTEMESFGS